MMGERVYLVLLRLYPASFRRRYGTSMSETFGELCRNSRSTGLRFWLFVICDTCRAASLQHFQEWTSDDRRIARQWLLACACGAVLCHVVGMAVTSSYRYLYHPFLERVRFVPSIYGGFLGVALASSQSLMFPRGAPRINWILLNALSAAVGMEAATQLASVTGPIAYGGVVGSVLAITQWLALRGRMQQPSAAALPSALTIAAATIGGSVALTRVLSGFNALQSPPQRWTPDALVQALYAPMTWSDCVLAIAFMTIAGLCLGAVTMNSASSVLARAQ
jgi:hypothetical protein